MLIIVIVIMSYLFLFFLYIHIYTTNLIIEPKKVKVAKTFTFLFHNTINKKYYIHVFKMSTNSCQSQSIVGLIKYKINL